MYQNICVIDLNAKLASSEVNIFKNRQLRSTLNIKFVVMYFTHAWIPHVTKTKFKYKRI